MSLSYDYYFNFQIEFLGWSIYHSIFHFVIYVEYL